MRFVVAFLIFILCLPDQILSQEKDSLIGNIVYDKSIMPQDISGIEMPIGFDRKSIIFSDFNHMPSFQETVLHGLNFKPLKGWKIQIGTPLNIGYTPYSLGLQSFQGFYNTQTYQVSDKLSIGTVGFHKNGFNTYNQNSAFYRQNYNSSSLFVGYKFSEKFSISAGVTIQRYGNPFNRNEELRNTGTFP